MRIRLSYFLLLIFALFLPNLSFAAVSTGPIKPEVVLPFYPELNPLTQTIRAPVVIGTTKGVAEIGKAGFIARIGSKAASGSLGGPVMAALTIADLSYEAYKWYHTDEVEAPMYPVVPNTTLLCASDGFCSGTDYRMVAAHEFSILPSVVRTALKPAGYEKVFRGVTNLPSIPTLIPPSQIISGTSQYRYDFPADGEYYAPVYSYEGFPITGLSLYYKGTVSNTPQMFVEIRKNPITSDSAFNFLWPALALMPASNVFQKPDGSVDDDYFSDADTTFDPTVSPNNIPMTFDELSKYVDWIRSGKAQTTDPLAPYYITPSNYQFTQNYINNIDNSVTNNTSGAVAPQQTTSSSAMTQTQYEESNKKADTEQATALNTAMNPLTNVLTQYNADKQFMIDKITSPTEPPAAMPDIFTWAWPTGSCQGFILKFNIYVPYIGVLSMDKLVNEHCPPYDEWAHPALFWFFNIITGLYLFRLWDKTAAEVVRI